MAITYVGAGAGTSATTGTITPALPAGILTNDLLVMVLETANQTQTISNSAGGTWTQVSGSPQGTGTAGGTTATGCQVFTSVYNGTQTAPTISNSPAADHRAGRIYAYRGVDTSAPVNASTGSVEATSDTSLSAPGVTTTVPDCWVLHAATLMDDAQNFGATFTNANLTGITVRDASFGHASGNDGRLVLLDGVKASAGGTGATTNTLTAASVKAFVTLALAPATVAGAATLTPVTLKLQPVTVTPTPGQVTTSITPAVLKLVAPAVGGAPGPGTLILTPSVLRLVSVAVTPTPQPVTTEITPAVLRLDPVAPVVPLIETFDKANGAPLGPERTWTSKVHVPSIQWVVNSNRAQWAVNNAASEIFLMDIQVPAPNIAGVPNQEATLDFVTATAPVLPGYSFAAGLLFRFATYDSDTNFRGYAALVGWNDADISGGGSGEVPAVWLWLIRYDAKDQATFLNVTGTVRGLIDYPATLTVRADSNQISAKFEHSGVNPLSTPLAVAATDTTYTDGDIALAGVISVDPTDSAEVSVDNLYAYKAPQVPASVVTQIIPTLHLSAAPVLFLNAIDALDSSTPPTDDYDGGSSSTPNTDFNDPEIGLTEINPLTFQLEAVPVQPVGSGPSQIPLTPVTFRLDAVAVSPAGIGLVTLTPATLALTAPTVTPTPGQVTTAITAAVLELVAVPVSPAGSGTGAATLVPVTLRLLAVALGLPGPVEPDPGWPVTVADTDQKVTVTDVAQIVIVVDPDNTIFISEGNGQVSVADLTQSITVNTNPSQGIEV